MRDSFKAYPKLDILENMITIITKSNASVLFINVHPHYVRFQKSLFEFRIQNLEQLRGLEAKSWLTKLSIKVLISNKDTAIKNYEHQLTKCNI